MIELEKTYLAKFLPKELKNCDKKEIIDYYIPKNSFHPCLRIRKNGDKYEITKKKPINEGDASSQLEQTIPLTKEEFEALTKNIEARITHKIRYYFNYEGKVAEFDIFQKKLNSLVLIDFEFNTEEEKENFEMPDFCLENITQEEFVAGGTISGKSYQDIENDLNRFNYTKLYLEENE